jgi:hypothetical protein
MTPELFENWRTRFSSRQSHWLWISKTCRYDTFCAYRRQGASRRMKAYWAKKRKAAKKAE